MYVIFPFVRAIAAAIAFHSPAGQVMKDTGAESARYSPAERRVLDKVEIARYSPVDKGLDTEAAIAYHCPAEDSLV